MLWHSGHNARLTMTIEITPTTRALGAEIRGVNLLDAVDDATSRRIYQGWLEHLVVVFRDQSFTDEQLVAVAHIFGKPELAPRSDVSDKIGGYAPSQPEIAIISNIKVDGVPIGSLGHKEAGWHTDMSFLEQPPSASLLHALTVPPSGGNTLFTNMYAAYDNLPAELLKQIEGRRAIHDYTYTSGGDLRKGFVPDPDVTQTPGARHPIVRNHPETDRKCLYLGRRRNGYILDLPVPESEELLDRLWAHATKPEFVWEHEWRVGDLVVWDNRCVMHSRRSFDPDEVRLMHRTQVEGSIPY